MRPDVCMKVAPQAARRASLSFAHCFIWSRASPACNGKRRVSLDIFYDDEAREARLPPLVGRARARGWLSRRFGSCGPSAVGLRTQTSADAAPCAAWTSAPSGRREARAIATELS